MSSLILTNPDPKLRNNASPIPAALFNSKELHEWIQSMREALASEKNGIGLAATQIGLSQRLILVELPGEGVVPFLNPEIIQHSKETILFEEGCLSVPGIFGMVKRKKQVTVRAFTPQGIERIQKWSGLYSVVFQHEIDHLNGILFIDKLVEKTNGNNVRV